MLRKHLSIALLLAVSAVLLITSSGFAQDADPQREMISSQFIPEDALALVVASPSEFLSDPSLEMFPIEVVRAQSKQQTGIDPMDVQDVQLVIGMPGPNGPAFGLVLHFSRDYAVGDLSPQLLRNQQPEQVDGLDVYAINGPPGTVLLQHDPRTLIVGPRWYIQTVAEAEESGGMLANLVTKIPRQPGLTGIAVVPPIRPMLVGLAKQQADQLPPGLQGLPRIPEIVDAVMINANMSGVMMKGKLQLVALCNDEQGAEELEQIVNQAIEFGRATALAEAERNVRGDDPVAEAGLKYAERMADKLTTALTPERSGRRLRVSIESDVSVASVGVMAGLLLPAVQSAREAARRMSASNNLKQIMLAMHNYHDTYKHFPEPAIRDEEGKPLLSWRVAILPFIEQQALYEQFHLDEPWDSEHNKALLEQMPEVYVDPSTALPPGQTVLQAVVGEEIGLKPEEKTRFRDITDGTSNTILVVETSADSAVPWTKPADVEIDLDNPLAKMGDAHVGGFNVAFADGAVRFIANTVDPELFKKLLTRAGGEVIGEF